MNSKELYALEGNSRDWTEFVKTIFVELVKKEVKEMPPNEILEYVEDGLPSYAVDIAKEIYKEKVVEAEMKGKYSHLTRRKTASRGNVWSSADVWEKYPDKRTEDWKRYGLPKYLELRELEQKKGL